MGVIVKVAMIMVVVTMVLMMVMARMVRMVIVVMMRRMPMLVLMLSVGARLRRAQPASGRRAPSRSR
eukprot:5016507-Pyramimonas_sp.AAC.1